jgi:hypothetical protein
VNVSKEQFLSLINLACPLIEKFIISNDIAANFQLDLSNEWVCRLSPDRTWRRMCWLPHKRRHDGKMACWGQKVAIGAASGIVTILDFSKV